MSWVVARSYKIRPELRGFQDDVKRSMLGVNGRREMRHGEDCNNINNLRAGRGVGILTCTLNCVGVQVVG